jgi:hypothetical protein
VGSSRLRMGDSVVEEGMNMLRKGNEHFIHEFTRCLAQNGSDGFRR